MRAWTALRPFVAATLALLGAAMPATAQRVDLTPFAAWRAFGDGDRIAIKDGAAFGASATLWGARGLGVELGWSGQSTTMSAKGPIVGGLLRNADLRVDHFTLLGMREFARGETNVRPYGGAGVGMTRYDAGTLGSKSQFLLAANGGVRLRVAPQLGMNLGARAYYTVTEANSGFGCGIGVGGGNCGFGFGTAGIFSMDFLLGLDLSLGGRRPAGR